MKTIRILSIATVLALVVIVGCSLLGKTGATKTDTATTTENNEPTQHLMVEAVDTKPVTYDNGNPIELTADDETSEETLTQKTTTVLNGDEAAKLLSTIQLTSLLTSKKEKHYTAIYNGFCGADNYRIELFINDLLPENSNPFKLKVDGKRRYKKQIADFAGEIDIEKVVKIIDYNNQYRWYKKNPEDFKNGFNGDSLTTYYSIVGNLRFDENKSAKYAGSYIGKLFMDVQKNEYANGKYTLVYMTNSEEEDGYMTDTIDDTKGAGLLLSGQWNSYDGNTSRNFLVGSYLFGFADDVLTNFSYGERERQISSKYRALGWDDYWENNEWWATGGEKSNVGL